MTCHGGLPTKSGRICGALFYRASPPGISNPSAVAGWLSLSDLRCTKELAGARGSAAVCGLRVSEFGDGRDDLPKHTLSAHGLVPGDVGSDQSKERCKRYRTSVGAGLGSVDLAA
jgi:hypothetical protein